IPFATAKEVITQVPWLALTPRLPATVGTATLAMVESSTCMKVPSTSATDAKASGIPESGGSPPSSSAGAVPAIGRLAARHVDRRLHRQADAQGMGAKLGRIEGDADG